MGIDGDERDEMVTTLLDDVVLHLMEHRLAPRDLARYLVGAFRNRARRRHRDAGRRDAVRSGLSREIGSAQQRVVAECISEYTLGAGRVDEGLARNAVLRGLTEWVAGELSADEMKMMVGIGRHMPLREIADQLRITYGAARVRVHRLRERFRRIATDYVATLEPEDKKEIARFFRRAGFELAAAAHQSAQQKLREHSQ